MNAIRRGLAREITVVRRVLRRPRATLRRWKGYTSPGKGGFVELNHDTAKTFLLVSSGRSGSTWLSEVLVEAFSCRMIFEPLRRDKVTLAAGVPWGRYAEPGVADPELERVVGLILAGRVRSQWTDKFNLYRFPRRRLVKEVRATNLLPWLRDRYPDIPIIYLLRHPVPMAWSAAELRLKPYFSEYLGQPLLMDGPLAPWRELIERHIADPDPFHCHVLRWCMENSVPIRQLAPGSVHVVFYEDLVEDPHGELERLARYLSRFKVGAWDFDPARPTVDRPSRANYRKTPMMSADARLRSWVDTVPAASVERAIALVEEFGLGHVYGTSVRPGVSAEALLQGDVVRPASETPAESRGTEPSPSR
jgi:hypothetical protein